MDHQIKKTIVKALMNAVDSAPTNSNSKKMYEPVFQSENPYQKYAPKPIFQPKNPYHEYVNYQITVSKSSFDVWINYIFSVLETTEPYVNPYLYLAILNQIQNIAIQADADYTKKTLEICKIILEFARQILNL